MSAGATPRIPLNYEGEEGLFPGEIASVTVENNYGELGADTIAEADNEKAWFDVFLSLFNAEGLDLAAIPVAPTSGITTLSSTFFDEAPGSIGSPFTLRGIRVMLEAASNELYESFRNTHKVTFVLTAPGRSASRSIDLVHAVGGDTLIRNGGGDVWPAETVVELWVGRNRWTNEAAVGPRGELKIRVSILGSIVEAEAEGEVAASK